MNPTVKAFFNEPTFTVSYVVQEVAGNQCVIIDSVLDYDAKSGYTSTDSADQIIAYVNDCELSVAWLLETHAHADHLSAARYIKEKVGGRTGIGQHIQEVQSVFGKVFNADDNFLTDGSQFDHLFKDAETFSAGELKFSCMATPGHTPACMTYVVGDAAFVGDTLFMPDYGTARADFPGGDAAQLYQSIQRIFTLPGTTRLFMCHDYKAPGRTEFCWESSVAEEQALNIHVGSGKTQEEFVAMRQARDKTLAVPNLLLPSIQVNIRAGEMPPPENNGISYLKIPINEL